MLDNGWLSLHSKFQSTGLLWFYNPLQLYSFMESIFACWIAFTFSILPRITNSILLNCKRSRHFLVKLQTLLYTHVYINFFYSRVPVIIYSFSTIFAHLDLFCMTVLVSFILQIWLPPLHSQPELPEHVVADAWGVGSHCNWSVHCHLLFRRHGGHSSLYTIPVWAFPEHFVEIYNGVWVTVRFWSSVHLYHWQCHAKVCLFIV